MRRHSRNGLRSNPRRAAQRQTDFLTAWPAPPPEESPANRNRREYGQVALVRRPAITEMSSADKKATSFGAGCGCPAPSPGDAGRARQRPTFASAPEDSSSSVGAECARTCGSSNGRARKALSRASLGTKPRKRNYVAGHGPALVAHARSCTTTSKGTRGRAMKAPRKWTKRGRPAPRAS